ncbi:MAG: hydroxyethylthiazole kinase, partial [Methanobacteriaceae archaeon]
CMTNFVTVNDCANAILAVGGAPIMGENPKEVEEIINISKSLLINIGTLHEYQFEGMEIGGKHANKVGIPITLDPVGVGATTLRNDSTVKLLSEINFTVIRGNMSEIKSISTLLGSINKESMGEPIAEHIVEPVVEPVVEPIVESMSTKGVEVAESDITTKENLIYNAKIVKSLAKKLDTVIVASGEIDIISNGEDTYWSDNGDEIMPKITGSGCMLSAIVATYLSDSANLLGVLTAVLVMNISGEKAAEYVRDNNAGTGTFRAKLIDNLSLISENDILEKSKLYKLDI